MPLVDTGAENNVARVEMPQIPQEQLEEFVRWLNLNDIKVTLGTVPAKALHPIQDHVNKDKIAEMLKNVDELRKSYIVVSDGYYILDGHHRWYAMNEHGPSTHVKVIHAHTDINALVELGREFEGSFVAGINETQLQELVVTEGKKEMQAALEKMGWELNGYDDNYEVWDRNDGHTLHLYNDGYAEVDNKWDTDNPQTILNWKQGR